MFGREGAILYDSNFQLLLLATVLSPLGTGLVSPVIDSLITPFDTSAASIGLLMAVFGVPAVVLTPFSGLLADRYGRKWVIVAGLVLLGVGGVAISLTTDFGVVLGLRFVQGVGFAGLLPTTVTSIGDLYQGDEEATAQGLRLTMSGVSLTVFPFLAGTLVAFSWRYPFLLYGIALPIAALVALGFHDPAEAADADGSGTGPPVVDAQVRALVRLVVHRRVLVVVLARILPVMTLVGFLTYVSILVVRINGETPQQAGLLVAIVSVVLAGSASQAGRVTTVFGGRFHALFGANVCLGTGFAVVALAPSAAPAIAGSVLCGLGFGLTESLYRSVLTGFAPDALRGGLVSLGESAGRLGSVLAPVVMGAAISLATPVVGFESALRLTCLGVGVVAGVGGVLSILLARPLDSAPPVGEESADSLPST